MANPNEPVPKTLIFRMPKDLYNKVRDISWQLGITSNEYMVMAINAYLSEDLRVRKAEKRKAARAKKKE